MLLPLLQRSKLLKTLKTSKLFFDKYANRVVINVALATLFRDRNLDNVKSTLDQYIKLLDSSPTGYIEFNSRWSRRRYSHSDIFQAYRIYDELVKAQDFSVRVEGVYLGIYSNDDDLIEYFANLNPEKTDTLSMPVSRESKEFLLSQTNTIIVKKKTHEYKLKLNPLHDGAPAFMEWASKLQGVKIFKNERVYQWTRGVMYVPNDKTLTLCKLYLGDKIARIDRLALSDEI